MASTYELELRPDLIEAIVITPLLPTDLDSENAHLLQSDGHLRALGEPHADTGLTGRKIIVDTYGGMARHGGGAPLGEGPVEGGPLGDA